MRARILVGNSVYEHATLTVTDGVLYVEFESDDLDDIAIPMEALMAVIDPYPEGDA